MKPLLYLLLIITLTFAACKKSGQSPYNVTFTFKGTQYNVVNLNARYTSISMYASGKSGSTVFNMYIFSTTPGIDTLGQHGTLSFATGTTADDYYFCNSGTATINSFDSKGATGTFSGMAGHPGGIDTTRTPVSGTFNVRF